jgi:ABC-type Fe3+/spermidine/putrescine transport system ATPase subunit
MRVELKLPQRQLGLASIYATHDQAEAMVLADHLVVMRNGIIEQEGRAEDVFVRPRSRFIASFLGVTNLLKGRVTETGAKTAQLEVPNLGALWAYLADDVRTHLAPGDAAWVSIRPLELNVSRTRPVSATNVFAGRVTERIFLGDLTEYYVATGDIRWRAHVGSSQQFAPGDTLWMHFEPDAGTIVLNS